MSASTLSEIDRRRFLYLASALAALPSIAAGQEPPPVPPAALAGATELLGLELTELHLDLRREGLDHRVLVRIAGADALDEGGRLGQLPFPDVEQDEDRLLGQEAETTDRL